MIRNLTIVAVASFVLCVGCFAGAFALGGHELIHRGWTLPSDWRVDIDDDHDSIHVGPGRVRVQNGETTTRTIAWAGSDALQIDVPGEVIFTQAAPGAGASVKVTGPRLLVDQITVENGRIAFKNDRHGDGAFSLDGHDVHVIGGDDHLTIEVTAPAVRAFTLNGSSDLSLKAYNQPDLALAINGSGSVEAEGKAGKVNLQISGSGEANLENLETGDAKIALSGSGEAHLAPHGATEVDLAGSGDVYLTAKPTVLTSNLAGSGEVHQDW